MRRRVPAGCTPFPRALLLGCGALALPCAIGIGLRLAGQDDAVVLLATILGCLPGIFLAIMGLPKGATARVVLAVALFAVLPVTIVMVVVRSQGFGPVPSLPVEAVARHPFAAGFRFTDGATPRATMAESVTILEPRSLRPRGFYGPATRIALPPGRDSFTIAPILPAAWVPGSLVHAVAIRASRFEQQAGPAPEAVWAEAGGLLRALADDTAATAVRQALARRGLAAASTLVIGTWVEDPAAVRLDAMQPALILLALAVAGWALLLMAGRRA